MKRWESSETRFGKVSRRKLRENVEKLREHVGVGGMAEPLKLFDELTAMDHNGKRPGFKAFKEWARSAGTITGAELGPGLGSDTKTKNLSI